MGWQNNSIFQTIFVETGAPGSGLYVYNGIPALGNPPIFAITGGSTTDPLGNPVTVGFIGNQEIGVSFSGGNIGGTVVTGSAWQGGTITEPALILDQGGGGLFLYAATLTTQTITTPGSGTINPPVGVSALIAKGWGPGQTGAHGNITHPGSSGTGGEFAQEPALAVTGGGSYPYTVGAGGSSTPTTLAGDAATLTASPGQLGGTGSNNTIHFNGGAGQPFSGASGAPGGGSSAGPSASGTAGHAASGPTGGAGGTAPSGGGSGGKGGNVGAAGTAGSAPGGGGGGGGQSGTFPAGGNGADGKLIVSYVTGQTLIGSFAGLAGTDPLTGAPYPAGGMLVTLQLNDSSAPAAVAGATVAYSSTGRLATVAPSGLAQVVPGANRADFTVNTVTQATLTNLVSATIPAADASAGTSYEIEAWGNGTWGATQQTLQLAVVLGGNTMASITLGALFMNASASFRWRAVARVICVTSGAGGTWTSLITGECSVFGQNLLSAGGSSVNATGAFTSSESSGTTTVDSTVSEVLSLQAAWGSTTGAPTITKRTSNFRRPA